MNEQPPPADRRPTPPWSWRWDLPALVSLGLLVGWLLAESWRRWPSALVDFGGQVYLPWRLTEGAVFGRELDLPYGPLSGYINAAIFRVWGPGIMHLVYANLAFYAALLGLSYAVLREGWGRLGAWAGSAVFVAVFSFSQLTVGGNYNYATPYAHEATHGLLACVALVYVMLRWRRRQSVGLAAAAGLLLGLTAVLKIECLVAAALVAAAGMLVRWGARQHTTWREAAAFGLGAVLPMAAFAVYFSFYLAWDDALATAAQAVANVVFESRFLEERVQLQFSGFDAPWLHLRQHAVATGVTVLVIGAVLAAARLAGREIRLRQGWTWLGWVGAIFLAGLAGLLGWLSAAWEQGPGFALLGLTAIATAAAVRDWFVARREGLDTAAAEARWLFGVLGMAMMLRMLLNGRVAHYGFYQAAVAAMVVVAGFAADWPRRFSRHGPTQGIAAFALLALVAGWAGRITATSLMVLNARTFPVGEGADRMLYFQPDVRVAAAVTKATIQFTEGRIGPKDKLLILPYGIMINYLSRREAPPGPTQYFAGPLAEGAEAELVGQLKQQPPEWVAVIDVNLSEHGLPAFGTGVGNGELLMRWVKADYKLETEIGPRFPTPSRLKVHFYRRIRPLPAAGAK